MNSVINKYLKLIFAYPKTLMMIFVVLMLGLSAGMTQFHSKNDVRIWFEPNDPKLDTLNFLEKTFGNDETLVIVAHLEEGQGNLFTPERMKVIKEITEEAWQIPQVIRVESLTNYNHIRAEENDIIVEPLIGDNLDADFLKDRKRIATEDKAIKGYLVGKEGKLALIFAHLIPSNVEELNYRAIIKRARSIVAKHKDSGLDFHLTGKASLNHAFEEVSMGDIQTILPLLFFLLIGYLYYVFRSIKAMVLPLIIVSTCVTATLGLGFWLDIHFSAILAILPIILVAIGIADSVHIMVNYFQFRGKGETVDEALHHTVNKNFVPTFLTSFSTSIGLFSLMTTKLVPIKHLGLLAGIGCMLAWLFTMFILIPLIKLIDYKIPPIFEEEEKKSDSARSSQIAGKIYKWVNHYRIPIVVVFSTLTIFSLWQARTIQTNADPDSYFSEDSKIAKANAEVKDHIGGSAGPDLILSAGGPDKAKSPEFLKKVETFNEWLRDLPPVNNTVSILDVIKRMNKVIHGDDPAYNKIPESQNQIAQYLFLYTLSLPPGMDINDRMSLDYSSTRISLLWTVYDTSNWAVYRDRIKAKAKELGLDLTIAGKANLFQDMIDYVVETFMRSIMMAMIFVALLLTLFFRSFKVGLISLIPNLLPICFGAATMAIFDMDLNLGTSLVASVCLGIAVDDTIHFLSNYLKNQKNGMSVAENIKLIYRYTGSALVITTLILSSAFGLYIFGDFLPNVNFGILCAVTLLSALVIDLIFLPALLILFDEKKEGRENQEEDHRDQIVPLS